MQGADHLVTLSRQLGGKMSRLIQPTAVLATMLIVELFPQAQAFQLGSSVLQLPGCADLARPGRALAAPLRAASRARRSGLLCARGQGDDGKYVSSSQHSQIAFCPSQSCRAHRSQSQLLASRRSHLRGVGILTDLMSQI